MLWNFYCLIFHIQCHGLSEVNFCICRGIGVKISFSVWLSIEAAPDIEKFILAFHNITVIICGKLGSYVCISLFLDFFHSLMYFFEIFLPILHCFNYYNSIINLDIWQYKSPHCSQPLIFPRTLQNQFVYFPNKLVGVLIGIALNLQVNMRRINILTILNLLIYKNSIFPPFFKVVFDYFKQSVIVFSFQNLHVIRFIPQYFFVCVHIIVNDTFLRIRIPTLIAREVHLIDCNIQTLIPATLIKSFISSKNIFEGILGILSIDIHIVCE